LESINADLQRKLAESENNNADLVYKVERLEENNNTLTLTLNGTRDDYDQLKEVHRNIQFKHENLERTLGTKELTLTDAEAEKAQLSQTLHHLREENDSRNTELDRLQRDLSSCQKKLTATEEALNDTQLRLEQERDSRGSDVNGLNRDLQSLRNELANLRQERHQLQTQLTGQTSQIEELHKQITQKQSQIHNLQHERDDLQRSNDNLSAAQSKAERLEQQCRNQSSDIGRTQEELELALRKGIESDRNLQEAKSEITRLEIENEGLKNRLENAERDNEELRERLDMMDKDLLELSNTNVDSDQKLRSTVNKNEWLAKQVENLTEELRQVRKLQVETEQQIDDLNLTHTKNRTLLDRNSGHFINLHQLYNHCASMIQEFVEEFKALSASSNYDLYVGNLLQEKAKRFNSSVVMDDYGQLEEVYQDVVEWMTSVMAELKKSVRYVGELKGEIHEKTQKIAVLEQKWSNLSTEDQVLKGRDRDLRAEIERLRDEKRQLEKDKDLLYGREGQLEKENDSLKNELRSLRRETENLRTDNKSVIIDRDSTIISLKEKVDCHDIDNYHVKTLEEKAAILAREKRSLDILFDQIYAAIPFPDFKRILKDMMQNRSELDMADREKTRIEGNLMQSEADMRMQARNAISDESFTHNSGVSLRKDVESLREQLSNCNTQVSLLKKRQTALQDELQSLSMAERRRYEISLDNEKTMITYKHENDMLKKEIQGKNLARIDIQNSYNALLDEKRQQDHDILAMRSVISPDTSIKMTSSPMREGPSIQFPGTRESTISLGNPHIAIGGGDGSPSRFQTDFYNQSRSGANGYGGNIRRPSSVMRLGRNTSTIDARQGITSFDDSREESIHDEMRTKLQNRLRDARPYFSKH